MATKAGAGKTVNKGEGSEFYAFLYILGETKLPLVAIIFPVCRELF